MAADVIISSQLTIDRSGFITDLSSLKAEYAQFAQGMRQSPIEIPVRGLDEITAQVRAIVRDLANGLEVVIPVRYAEINSSGGGGFGGRLASLPTGAAGDDFSGGIGAGGGGGSGAFGGGGGLSGDIYNTVNSAALNTVNNTSSTVNNTSNQLNQAVNTMVTNQLQQIQNSINSAVDNSVTNVSNVINNQAAGRAAAGGGGMGGFRGLMLAHMAIRGIEGSVDAIGDQNAEDARLQEGGDQYLAAREEAQMLKREQGYLYGLPSGIRDVAEFITGNKTTGQEISELEDLSKDREGRRLDTTLQSMQRTRQYQGETIAAQSGDSEDRRSIERQSRYDSQVNAARREFGKEEGLASEGRREVEQKYDETISAAAKDRFFSLSSANDDEKIAATEAAAQAEREGGLRRIRQQQAQYSTEYNADLERAKAEKLRGDQEADQEQRQRILNTSNSAVEANMRIGGDNRGADRLAFTSRLDEQQAAAYKRSLPEGLMFEATRPILQDEFDDKQKEQASLRDIRSRYANQETEASAAGSLARAAGGGQQAESAEFSDKLQAHVKELRDLAAATTDAAEKQRLLNQAQAESNAMGDKVEAQKYAMEAKSDAATEKLQGQVSSNQSLAMRLSGNTLGAEDNEIDAATNREKSSLGRARRSGELTNDEYARSMDEADKAGNLRKQEALKQDSSRRQRIENQIEDSNIVSPYARRQREIQQKETLQETDKPGDAPLFRREAAASQQELDRDHNQTIQTMEDRTAELELRNQGRPDLAKNLALANHEKEELSQHEGDPAMQGAIRQKFAAEKEAQDKPTFHNESMRSIYNDVQTAALSMQPMKAANLGIAGGMGADPGRPTDGSNPFKDTGTHGNAGDSVNDKFKAAVDKWSDMMSNATPIYTAA